MAEDALSQFDAAWRKRFRAALIRWFQRHGRDLPWRADRDPYRVWIREIMLQQTTVAAVRPYFERFVERFPTVESLADASEDDVLRLWEGLGYYRRARYLHRAARRITEEYSGCFPESVAELQRLPGVGRYTAGAIASFAFDQRAPIVEANTLRLYARLIGHTGEIKTASATRLLWNFAELILPRVDCGAFNQALMDLGATVCQLRDPSCGNCPVKTCCQAFQHGMVEHIPRLSARAATLDLTEVALLIRRRGRILIRRCGPDERWAGLWDFPRFSIDTTNSPDLGNDSDLLPAALQQEICLRIRQLSGLSVSVERRFADIRHTVTRYRIRLIGVVAETVHGRLNRTEREWEYVSLAELANRALPASGRMLVDRLPVP